MRPESVFSTVSDSYYSFPFGVETDPDTGRFRPPRTSPQHCGYFSSSLRKWEGDGTRTQIRNSLDPVRHHVCGITLGEMFQGNLRPCLGKRHVPPCSAGGSSRGPSLAPPSCIAPESISLERGPLGTPTHPSAWLLKRSLVAGILLAHDAMSKSTRWRTVALSSSGFWDEVW